jgi:hypothetical protein
MSPTAPFLSWAKERGDSQAMDGRRAPQSSVARRVQLRMSCMNERPESPALAFHSYFRPRKRPKLALPAARSVLRQAGDSDSWPRK